MKEILIFLTISISFNVGLMQQCRQMTVCDEDNVPGGREKGDVGAPGKAGPQGIKGNKGGVGEVGMKGIQGDSCALGSFESEMRQKLENLETRMTPQSCLTSSVYGKQILRSGEEAFCDGGWTVFQYRFNGSLNFDVGWELYKVGFGDFNGEFWLGLENVYRQTKHRGCKLRVDLWNSANDHEYAQYSSFSIEDESDFYRLHIDGFSGTAPDKLAYHNNMPFSTSDRDNDNHSGNCARDNNYNGWWFDACSHSRLNADWPRVSWGENKLISVMKFRCD